MQDRPTIGETRHYFRGDDGYEQARSQTVWNARTPQRYPEVVVQAVDVDDVVATVRYAQQYDMRIGVRSGGHSWAGNHVRDGGVLLDVSRLDQCTIDADAAVAVVGPGMGGSILAARLAEQDLFFPVGHCTGVCIGGYLLQGGYGWNSRILGPACESVLGLDVVTADGERRVELQIVASRAVPGAGLDTPGIVMASPVFADTEQEADQALALLETCPVRDSAIVAVPYAPADLDTWYSAVMTNYPTGYRYATDNMWTSAPIDELMPGIRSILETMPPHPAHFLWLNWGPSPQRQDMAYSLEDETYIALYSVWKDAADDQTYRDWARSGMAAMEHLQTGTQLADENLGERPAPFATADAMARLDRVRSVYDPDGRFHSWMGRV